jgi:hypothetical protein
MHTRSLRLLALLLACLLGSQGVLADYPIEVITLKSRPVDEVLPIVRPFAGGDGSVTGTGNHLIVKASPERLRDIRRLLEEIDLPPHRLLIILETTGRDTTNASGYAASVDIKSGDNRASINSPGRAGDRTQGSISAHASQGKTTNHREQQVQALEGYPAFIRTGLSSPSQERRPGLRSGKPYNHQYIGSGTETGGFYVLPRLSGDFVTLKILQQNDRTGWNPNTLHSQQTGTVVRGKLGEWIELGGIHSSVEGKRSGIARSGTASATYSGGLRVKVQCMDCQD